MKEYRDINCYIKTNQAKIFMNKYFGRQLTPVEYRCLSDLLTYDGMKGCVKYVDYETKGKTLLDLIAEFEDHINIDNDIITLSKKMYMVMTEFNFDLFKYCEEDK